MTATSADVRRMRAIVARVRRLDVRVRLVDGWEQRGRPMAFAPRGVLDHHDASTIKSGEWGALGVITLGRPGIPGPLAQFQVARCLHVPQIAVIAAGRCNHAGIGGPWRGIPKDSGNRYLYGVEKANDGLDEPGTDLHHYAADVLFASILEEL